MSNFYTSAEAMTLDEFTEIVASEGWIARKPVADETEQETDMIFEAGGEAFAAWEEGSHIGAKRYPRSLQTVVYLYEEGTDGYDRVNGTGAYG